MISSQGCYSIEEVPPPDPTPSELHAEIRRLHEVIDEYKAKIEERDLSIATLRRRVESLEADRT